MEWLNLDDSVNQLSLIGAAVIILATLVVVAMMFAQMKVKRDTAELTEHNWDGIGEYKNPVPVGWLVIFFLTIVWMLWYFLLGYPLNSYSQVGEYNEEVSAHNAKFQQRFQDMSQEDKIAMGQNLFLVQCAPCHGITGDGINGKAQNLSGFWGTEEAIKDVVINGTQGNSPLQAMSKAADLGLTSEEDINAVVAYVAERLSALKKTKNPDLASYGELVYQDYCVACHQLDGTSRVDGSEPMAGDLTKYGSAAFTIDILNRGKDVFIGSMPKFDENLLNDIQKEAVSEYVNSLTRGQ